MSGRAVLPGTEVATLDTLNLFWEVLELSVLTEMPTGLERQ